MLKVVDPNQSNLGSPNVMRHSNQINTSGMIIDSRDGFMQEELYIDQVLLVKLPKFNTHLHRSQEIRANQETSNKFIDKTIESYEKYNKFNINMVKNFLPEVITIGERPDAVIDIASGWETSRYLVIFKMSSILRDKATQAVLKRSESFIQGYTNNEFAKGMVPPEVQITANMVIEFDVSVPGQSKMTDAYTVLQNPDGTQTRERNENLLSAGKLDRVVRPLDILSINANPDTDTTGLNNLSIDKSVLSSTNYKTPLQQSNAIFGNIADAIVMSTGYSIDQDEILLQASDGLDEPMLSGNVFYRALQRIRGPFNNKAFTFTYGELLQFNRALTANTNFIAPEVGAPILASPIKEQNKYLVEHDNTSLEVAMAYQVFEAINTEAVSMGMSSFAFTVLKSPQLRHISADNIKIIDLAITPSNWFMVLDRNKTKNVALDSFEKLKRRFKLTTFDILFNRYPHVEVTVYFSYNASYITIDIGHGAKVTVPFGTAMASTFETQVTTQSNMQSIVKGYDHICTSILDNIRFN